MSKTKLPKKWYIKGSRDLSQFLKKLETTYKFNSTIIGDHSSRCYFSHNSAIKTSKWNWYESIAEDRQEITLKQLEDHYFSKTKTNKMNTYNKGETIKVKLTGHYETHSSKFKGKEGVVNGKTTYKGVLVGVVIEGKNRYIHNSDLIKVKPAAPKKTGVVNSFPITRAQFQDIYNIACSDWKARIIKITKSTLGDFKNEGTLDRAIVKEMFEASNEVQKKVLLGIFPDYSIKDTNPFKEQSTQILSQISRKLFGDELSFQIGFGAVPADKQDLVGRSLFVKEIYEVKLHKGLSGCTIIEFIEK